MKQEKKRALGRGLEALLPRKLDVLGATMPTVASPSPRPIPVALPGPVTTDGTATPVNSADPHCTGAMAGHANIYPGETVIEIPLDLISRNPYQTRVTMPDDPNLQELADSIKAHGVMQPIVVRPLVHAGAGGELYQLIAGERRWLASKRAGKTHVPAIARELSGEQVLVLTIIENLHRQDLNPMQHARALERLAEEFRLTQEEVAARTGLARSAVANYLRLVRLPQDLQNAVADGRLGFGHIKVLMGLGNTAERDLLAHKVIAGKLTVRETEALVEAFLHPKTVEAVDPGRKIDPNVRAAEAELQRALGCPVQIRDRNGKGRIVIVYKSLEDFDRVVEALKD